MFEITLKVHRNFHMNYIVETFKENKTNHSQDLNKIDSLMQTDRGKKGDIMIVKKNTSLRTAKEAIAMGKAILCKGTITIEKGCQNSRDIKIRGISPMKGLTTSIERVHIKEAKAN